MLKSKSKSKSKSDVVGSLSGEGRVTELLEKVPAENELGKEKDAQEAVGDSMSQLQLKDEEHVWRCSLCLQKSPSHADWQCPYNLYVPVGAEIGKGYYIACTACDQPESQHYSTDPKERAQTCLTDGEVGERDVDWQGYAIPTYCIYCGSYSDHSTTGCKHHTPSQISETRKMLQKVLDAEKGEKGKRKRS